MKLCKLEYALIFALLIAVTFGALSAGAQNPVEDKLIRLHVVANSDSEADQELKLLVRDRVLDTAALLTDGCADKAATLKILKAALPQITAEARDTVLQNGYDYGISAAVIRMYFETRTYPTFALPAGEYDTLRIEIGEGRGQNWWCVVFPPLCLAGAQKDLSPGKNTGDLTESDIAFITEDGPEYELRFKTVELFASLFGRSN